MKTHLKSLARRVKQQDHRSTASQQFIMGYSGQKDRNGQKVNFWDSSAHLEKKKFQTSSKNKKIKMEPGSMAHFLVHKKFVNSPVNSF